MPAPRPSASEASSSLLSPGRAPAGDRSSAALAAAVDGDSSAAAGGALGKHEELGTLRCTCAPKTLRLRSNHGELVTPRGGSVNRCDYCAQLAAVENCEMLVLDALEGDAPQLVAILGTRTATLDMSAFKLARKKLSESIRRRWPGAEYVYEVEFTTGYGPRSGGKRRPHWNWFWKGIPRADAAEFAALNRQVWCRYVDAEPEAQYCAEIDNAIGLTKYVTEHFMKASQRPPKGFTGQRFCASRGYFGDGVTVTTARARARESLRRKRAIWKATEAGFDAHDAELIAYETLVRDAQTYWVLTNERGVPIGQVIADPGRMVLARDRLGNMRITVAMTPAEQLLAGQTSPPAPITGGCSPPERVPLRSG